MKMTSQCILYDIRDRQPVIFDDPERAKANLETAEARGRRVMLLRLWISEGRVVKVGQFRKVAGMGKWIRVPDVFIRRSIANNIQDNMTFSEIYEEKLRRSGELNEFVKTVAKATAKTEMTVRQWAYGRQIPDALTQKAIADTLGVEVEGLFPVKPETSNTVSHEEGR